MSKDTRDAIDNNVKDITPQSVDKIDTSKDTGDAIDKNTTELSPAE